MVHPDSTLISKSREARASHGCSDAGETGRTSPYQDNSACRRPLRETFKEQLPQRPYCTDLVGHRLVIRPRALALRFNHIQLNAPAAHRFLPFDIDHAEAAWAWEEANLPAPYESASAMQLKPWTELGISRATWYRRLARTRRHADATNWPSQSAQ